jgi:hypothetical protein
LAGNRYIAIVEDIFRSKFKSGMTSVDFDRNEIVSAAEKLGIKLPANLGDLIYTFRFRAAFPESIAKHAPKGHAWVIRLVGRSKYRFVLVADIPIVPNEAMVTTKVPDATPGIISKYALSDEQALLAKVRYNRLIDIFTGITCYSLQNHLRTTVPGVGQIETDELYVGVDRAGTHYVIPVQAKGGKDRLSIVQIEQDLALCAHRYPALVSRAVACQFMADDIIAMFAFEESPDKVGIAWEKHYRLVPPDEVTDDDLHGYRAAAPD